MTSWSARPPRPPPPLHRAGIHAHLPRHHFRLFPGVPASPFGAAVPPFSAPPHPRVGPGLPFAGHCHRLPSLPLRRHVRPADPPSISAGPLSAETPTAAAWSGARGRRRLALRRRAPHPRRWWRSRRSCCHGRALRRGHGLWSAPQPRGGRPRRSLGPPSGPRSPPRLPPPSVLWARCFLFLVAASFLRQEGGRGVSPDGRGISGRRPRRSVRWPRRRRPPLLPPDVSLLRALTLPSEEVLSWVLLLLPEALPPVLLLHPEAPAVRVVAHSPSFFVVLFVVCCLFVDG